MSIPDPIRKRRILARLGLSTSIPSLLEGEIAYDRDTKTFRVGDGTSTPPRVLTDKSSGTFEYPNLTAVKYPRIEMNEDGTVDGVDVSKLNAQTGILVRVADNDFASRMLTNTDGYLDIQNANGQTGDINLDVSAKFLQYITENAGTTIYNGGQQPGGGNIGDYWFNNEELWVYITDGISKFWYRIYPGGIKFTYGTTPPSAGSSSLGDMFYSTEKELLYIRIHDAQGALWYDISTSGGGSNGLVFTADVTPPANARPGDQFYDIEKERLYARITDGRQALWIDISV